MEVWMNSIPGNTPDTNGEADARVKSNREVDYTELDKARNGDSFNEINDIEDNLSQHDDDDKNMNQNENEQFRVPLLSPTDRLPEPLLKRSVKFSPVGKRTECGGEIQDVVISVEIDGIHQKHADRLSIYNGNRHHPGKEDQQSYPLLQGSDRPRVVFLQENIEQVDADQCRTGVSSETWKVDKCEGFHEGDRLFKNAAPTSPRRYNGQRRKGPIDAAVHRAKGYRGKTSKELHPELLRHMRWKILQKVVPGSKKELTKVELLKSYRLHIFVAIIFIITVLSVSLAWYYKNEAQEKLYSSQAIFFDPRSRKLTLSDSSKSFTIKGLLGQDIPKWILPLHCPIVMGDDPHNKECLWKRIAILRVNHFQEAQIQCYNVSWESLGSEHLPHDCFYINTAKWYGPSNQSYNSFPIEGEFEYRPFDYRLNNNGIFNSVVDFYWLSSSGSAIYVNADNPIQVTWNISGSNQVCFRSNFSGAIYHKVNSQKYPSMNYTLCQGTDILVTHLFMQKIFAATNPVQYPDEWMLQGSHWSVKNLVRSDQITQTHVIQLAISLSTHRFQNSIITMDNSWQKFHGDLVFDENRFSNVAEMMKGLNSSGCFVTLCVSPYFHYTSQNFHTGVTANIFAKDAGGDVTGLINFQGRLAAILDVFYEGGRQWFSQKLQNLTQTLKINSYRLTYGQQSWLPYKAHFSNVEATPNMYRKLNTKLFATVSNLSLVVEHTSDSHGVTSLVSVPTGLSKDRKCLTGVIERALTLGLMGYPFLLADGIQVGSQTGGNVDNKPSRELYIRWLQLASLFPAYQHSIAPWDYDQNVVYIATNLSVFHKTQVLSEINSKKLQLEVEQGSPILRPVWWLDPDNSSVHDLRINDEFLIGNDLLVAPVLCEGVTERSVYVPPGIWEYVDQKTIMLGPDIVWVYNMTIEHIIVFHRRSGVVRNRRKSEL